MTPPALDSSVSLALGDFDVEELICRIETLATQTALCMTRHYDLHKSLPSTGTSAIARPIQEILARANAFPAEFDASVEVDSNWSVSSMSLAVTDLIKDNTPLLHDVLSVLNFWHLRLQGKREMYRFFGSREHVPGHAKACWQQVCKLVGITPEHDQEMARKSSTMYPGVIANEATWKKTMAPTGVPEQSPGHASAGTVRIPPQVPHSAIFPAKPLSIPSVSSKDYEKVAHTEKEVRLARTILLGLFHASRCNNSRDCSFHVPPGQAGAPSHCMEFKGMWRHAMDCKLATVARQNECQVPGCKHVKRVVLHYKQCIDNSCQVCLPVRKTIDKIKGAPVKTRPKQSRGAQSRGAKRDSCDKPSNETIGPVKKSRVAGGEQE